MQKTLKLLALSLFLTLFSASTNYSNASNLLPQPEQTETIIVDIIVIGLHQMSWTPMSGTGPYTVAILNLNTNTTHCTFSTTATSSLVYGLVSGVNYRVMLSRGSNIIIIDIIAS